MTPLTASFGRKLALLTVGATLVFAVSASSADTFAVTLVSQTSTTVTLGWTPQPGYGYLFSLNGQLVSRTNDASRSTVKFSKGTSYDIDVIVKGANGHYPTAPPPPPPTATITQTIVAGSTIVNLTSWRAVYDGNNDGAEDDPGSVEFRIDGTVVATESLPPFGDTFADGSITTTNGQHQFQVVALGDNGGVLVTNTVTATVNNQTPPPPPPPPGGFPDASNTGVPAGTQLTTVGGFTAATAGAVYDGLNVTGVITVTAPGVTIKNSKVRGIDLGGTADSDTSPARLLIQDVEIDCGGPGTKGIQENNFTAQRVNIHNCEDGSINKHNVTIEDSYIHDLATSSTAHNDGVQSYATHDIVIRHNRIYGVDTSAININNDVNGAHSTNVLVENNLLAGGAWTLYCPKPSTTNVRILNNAFSTIFYPKVGFFGSNTDCSGETGSGNYIYETGAPVSLNT